MSPRTRKNRRKKHRKEAIEVGRRSTKENKSIWQTTREDLGLTREKAGELIPGFSPERIEKIENGRTQIQPEDALLLA